jgi:V/A-type H+-transporting ATPase subunit C
MSALDSYHFRNASKFGKLFPLSFLPFLDYFIWKRIEVDNIRIICRGKQAGLSEDLIRSMLIT